ncbi:MAG TPA: FkbM family methyltransferase [Opitutaceae bacterium]|nr:FkbM family methyltransferase [Opitutaceae bacterium]
MTGPLQWLPDGWKERLRRRAGAVTLGARLENLRRAGFAPGRIVDAGAYRGAWSAAAAEVFPRAALLLVEPQPGRTAELEAFCRSHPAARLRAAALGRQRGVGRLLLEETNSRLVGSGQAPGAGAVSVPVETLADLLPEEGFCPCDLLKLDLQGHELEALQGAGAALDQVEVIMTEVSLIPIGGAPLALEVAQLLDQRGFRLYDILGHNYRPRDRALWQADFLFVRRDSALLASASWA